MAHPPDPALTRVLGEVIGHLRAEGWTTNDLAERLDVSPPTISRWENGGRSPSLDVLPRFDALLGRPRGEVLRRAGYVLDDPADVVAAIMADPVLTDLTRGLLVDLYESILRRSGAPARPIPDPKSPREMEIWAQNLVSEEARRNAILEMRGASRSRAHQPHVEAHAQTA